MQTSILIERIVQMRIEKSHRQKTKTSYSHLGNGFIEWLKLTDNDSLISQFTRGKAHQFLDYLALQRKVSNRTINNYKNFISGCFQEAVYREYITKNPFEGIKDFRIIRQKREAFTKDELMWMLGVLKARDPQLYLFCLFVYGTLIRPIEVTRLKFHMVDLDNFIVNLPAEITKNWCSGHPTLPRWIVFEMKELGVDKQPKNDYIFGKGFKPGPEKPCGHHTPNRRHKEYIDLGKSKGILRENANLSLYSWKYTGGEAYAEVLNPYELQRQMRHKHLETTMLYLKEKVGTIQNVIKHNPGIRIGKGIKKAAQV